MSERQAGYAPQDGDEDGVRVKVQVQAPSEEIEDLVDVIVGRLESAELVVEYRATEFVGSKQGSVELVLRPVLWLS